MRAELLIVNPNTNASVTRWLAEEARRVAGAAFDVVAMNAASGLAAIETPADVDAAARAVVACLAARPTAAGAIIAAFGDPGLAAARALRACPVVGLGEAGMRAAGAGAGGRGFSILTLGAAMRAPILARAAALRLQPVEVVILPFSIADMVRDREACRARITAAVKASQGEAVLLGGAPFAGMAREIARETGRVVLDGVAAAVEAIAFGERVA